MFFSLLTLTGILAKVQTIMQTSVLCDEPIVYRQLIIFPMQAHVTTDSGFLFIQRLVFVVHPPVRPVKGSSVMFKEIRQLSQSPGTETRLLILSTRCQFILGKYKLLGVGRNWLAAF